MAESEPQKPEAPAQHSLIGPMLSVELTICQKCGEWILPGDEVTYGEFPWPEYAIVIPAYAHAICPSLP